jgi:hypothetical protein
MTDSRKNWQNDMPLENKTCTFKSRNKNNTSTEVMLPRVGGEILASVIHVVHAHRIVKKICNV